MLIVSRGATAEWPMRKDDTHNSRLLGSMIGPKLFCESVGPQHKIISLLAPRLEFYLQLGLTTLQLHLLACAVAAICHT